MRRRGFAAPRLWPRCWRLRRRSTCRASTWTGSLVGPHYIFICLKIYLFFTPGYSENMTCFVQLWSAVAQALHAHGKQLAISVDDSGGRPFAMNATDWCVDPKERKEKRKKEKKKEKKKRKDKERRTIKRTQCVFLRVCL